MRLHTDRITLQHLRAAASVAEVNLDTHTEHASRSRQRAWEVRLVGTDTTHSARRPATGRYGSTGQEVYAATWDQWGVFLRHLYEIDPSMLCGMPMNPTYGSLTHFNLRTDYRFKVNSTGSAVWPRDEHGDHRWLPGSDARTRECGKCTARQTFPVG